MRRSAVFVPILCLLGLGRPWAQVDAQRLLGAFERGETAVIIGMLESNAQALETDLGEGMTPIHYAAYTGNEAVFDYLLQRGMKTEVKDRRGLTPVWFTVSGMRPAMLRKLVARGADLGITDADGNTLLHRAAQTDNAEIVGILLEQRSRGLGLESRNARGATPFLRAVDFGRLRTAQALAVAGADVDMANADGTTALQVAIAKGSMEFVDLLLAHKARLDPVDRESGRTLLHDAAIQGRSTLVARLLAAGAPKHAKDANGRTALSYARKYGNWAVVDVLRKSGVADVPWPASSGEPVFLPLGRLLAEGRIFAGPVCHDFDRDGRLDLALSDFLNPARILFGDAGFEFTRVVALTSAREMATSGHGIALGDFDGDGRPDLLLAYNNSFPARLLLGDGRGGFTDSGRGIGTLRHATSVKAVDVDGDKDLDAFITYPAAVGRLFLNNGAGVLSESDQQLPWRFAVGDVDGDGDVDLVSPPAKVGEPALICLNDRGQSAARSRTLDVGHGLLTMDLVDVDGDKDLDLFVSGHNRVGGAPIEGALWMNDGRGTFSKLEQTFGTGRPAVGDIDGNGTLDLVVGQSVWLGRGGARFDKVQTLPNPRALDARMLVDIDADGDLDLVAARGDIAAGKLDILLFVNARSKR